MTKNQEDHNTE